ncbi:MAG: SusE domain-containing protein [Ferruginibacter sp.]|nr:SusE domain-containing protein [Ferruginibacter sp.]
MKKIFNNLVIILTALALFASCKKDGVLTYLDTVNFPRSLTASVNSVSLTVSNNDSSVISFSWPSVGFKIKAPVTYKLQFDLPADTIGINAWSNAFTTELGNDVLGKSFKGADLNTIALTKLGLVADSLNTVLVRVIAVLDRSVYSNAIAVKVKPFKVITLKKLYVPGDYQGWNPAAAPVLAEAAGRPEMYEGFINIPAGGSYQFKITAQADWTPTAYGDATGNSGNIIVANYAGGNMSVPTGGYYELTVNLNTNKWTATKTTWSIIGDASPGGWNNDTQLAYDVTNQVWKVTCDMLKNGSFKFRANNAWIIDFGIDSNKKLVYADNPFFGYTGGLDNLSVPADGNYTITLDLHNSGNYTYDLHKN